MAALDPNFLDAVELDREIAETREQVHHLKGSCARPWNPQMLAKLQLQRDNAIRHLARLEKLRDTT